MHHLRIILHMLIVFIEDILSYNDEADQNLVKHVGALLGYFLFFFLLIFRYFLLFFFRFQDEFPIATIAYFLSCSRKYSLAIFVHFLFFVFEYFPLHFSMFRSIIYSIQYT